MNVLLDIIARSQRQPSTRRLYTEAVGGFLAFAGQNPGAWTASTVEAWRDEQKKRGLRPGTINTRLQALRYASRRYQALGHGRHFAEPVELLADASERRRRALTAEQAMALVATTDNFRDDPYALRDRALLVVGLRTGIRRSELAQLGTDTQRKDVAGMSWIRHFRVRLKGGEMLDVTLDDEATDALGPWRDWLLERRVSGKFFRQLRRRIERERVEVGEPLAVESLWRIVTTRARQAGIRKMTIHELRNTYFSLSLQAGVPPERVAASVGHKRLDEVMRYYTDLYAERDPVGGHMPPFTKGRR